MWVVNFNEQIPYIHQSARVNEPGVFELRAEIKRTVISGFNFSLPVDFGNYASRSKRRALVNSETIVALKNTYKLSRFRR